MKVYIKNIKFWKQITYAFETLFRCIQICDYDFEKYDSNSVIEMNAILYAEDCPDKFKGIYIKEGPLFSDVYLKPESIPTVPLRRYEEIPVFYGDGEPEKCVVNSTVFYNWDLVQGTFFLITGYEEAIKGTLERDDFSRPYIKDRIVYKEKLLYTPIVNLYADILKKDVVAMGFSVEIIEHNALAHISHDVDLPYDIGVIRYIFNKILSYIGTLPLKYPISKGFSYMFNTEKKLGLKSSWYFFMEGGNLEYDTSYDLNDEALLDVISHIEDSGNEIGWHYSYDAAYDKSLMAREGQIFSKKFPSLSLCGRNHYLRYSIPNSWIEYEKCGVKYDATLASPYHEGFVFGICTPFQLFDIENGRVLDVWEIPLLIMDSTLKGYRELSEKDAFGKIRKIMDATKKYNGVFSILWHNSSVINKLWKKWDWVYEKTMKEISINFVAKTGLEIIDSYK